MFLHRHSYEKDIYKKVRIHCVNGRTLPKGKAMKKIFKLKVMFSFMVLSISVKCDGGVFII